MNIKEGKTIDIRKDIIEKACEWLCKNTYKHVDDSRVHMTFTHTVDMIESFRKAMEE